MYVNDLPLASQFQTTLFADDTHLIMAENSLAKLESKVNNKLLQIDTWLKQNKLSLNSSKSCYMLINKNPSKSCESDLRLSLNSFTLFRQHTVKYLGIYIDENLKWSTHIHHLSLQLARYAGIFYRIRNLLPLDTMRMLYHRFIYSRVQNGIPIWEMPPKLISKELSVRFNNIICSMTFSRKYSLMTPLYKTLNVLKLNDIYKLGLAKFMFQCHQKTVS